MKKIIFTLFLIFPSLIVYAQDTIHIPADYSTIQAGINAATNGDIVLVEEGTYLENINYRGKAITVASNFLVDSLESHIENTIIDGSQPSHPDSGSVVTFNSGEDTNSVLCGFTITGGTGTFIPAGPIPFNTRIGGGIYIAKDMGAMVINNIIAQNVISSNDGVGGGGIYSEDPGGSGFTIIEENIIQNNTASGEITYTMGGGIFMGGNGRIVRNNISQNLCYSVNADVVGGGVRLMSIIGQDTTSCLVENNLINDNKSLSVNGSAYAGGISTGGCIITMQHNIIYNNIVEGNIENHGAGMHVAALRYTEKSRIENNYFSSNNYMGNGVSFGGALQIYYSYPIINNNIFIDNEANYGGGICLLHNSQPELTNNTIVSNTASIVGGGIYSTQSTFTVKNSIIWDNSAPGSPQIYQSGGSSNVTYSDIEGSWPGTGNLNLNPELMDTILTSGDTLFTILSNGSPCIDAGNPDTMYYDPEDLNNPGYALWPSMGTLRNDMGAYGGQGAINWIVTYVSEEFQYSNEIPSGFQLSQNYPNPFNPSTKIQYSVNSTQKVTLKVYDLLGREIATLVNEEKPAGTYELIWYAGNIPSGIYFYQLKAANFVETKKMIFLK